MGGVLTEQAWVLELRPQYPRLIKTDNNKTKALESQGHLLGRLSLNSLLNQSCPIHEL